MMEVPPIPTNAAEIPSPALLLHWENVEENLRRMLAMVDAPERLRPHLKTHKLPQIIARLVQLGVTKAKAATIAEAEMAAGAGATDILLASPLVGPTVPRFLALMQAFPNVLFSGLADDLGALEVLNTAALQAGKQVNVLLDLDIGQHRTGVVPGNAAEALYHLMTALPGIHPAGLHAYDGHLHQTKLAERTAACNEAFATVTALKNKLEAAGHPVPTIVAGGTPTFPMHARRPGMECSPGTCILWDAGYAKNLPDLDFLPAATVLTRVISRPTHDRLCLDLGHKSIASEMPHPRALFPELPGVQAVMHNEEHLVLETTRAHEFPVGTPLMAVPWHVCPTVALHAFVHVVRDQRAAEVWPILARSRKLTY